MKTAIISSLLFFSAALFAQSGQECHWATESHWSCSKSDGGSMYAEAIFSPNWKTARVTISNGLSGEFKFISSDGKDETFKDDKENTLILPVGSCNSSSFSFAVNNVSYSCF